MNGPELAQLEMFAQIDELVRRLKAWSEQNSAWARVNTSQALVRRLLERVETLRVRLEAPLVVATFGGTGTGKSTLVNSLVGQECTESGRQRPTTTQPIAIMHPKTDAESLGIPLDEFRIVRHDASILRDLVIIDCPDPDTDEAAATGSNLERLRKLVPHCDVLIYVSTQQKYRSARVGEELRQAATGCRLLFVQTHAELDSDIREDWREQLGGDIHVDDIFFVDSPRALREQEQGHRPSGDFGRLQELLSTRLAVSQRVRIRRANLIDLIHDVSQHCRTQLDTSWPAIEKLENALDEQRDKLIASMSEQLGNELLLSRNLWERRLLSSVTQIWGFSPFSAMLRIYNGLGSLLASVGLLRARTSAQMVLIGAIQGTRWLTSKSQEKEADERLERISSFGLDDNLLREAQLVVSGYVHEAQLDPELASRDSLEDLRHEAVRVEERFLGDASQRIDQIIDDLAEKKSGLIARVTYETLFMSLVVFILFRIGRNFFWDSLFNEAAILQMDFYVSASVFFVLWSSILLMSFNQRLRRGLKKRIDELVRDLIEHRVATGLFPKLESCCRETKRHREQIASIAETTETLRNQVARSNDLGALVTDL